MPVIVSARSLALFSMKGIAKSRRKKRAKEALGTDSVLQASSVSLESGGFGSWLIEKAIQFSVDEYNLPSSLLKAGSYGFSKKACLFEKAGINRVLTGNGYACARIYFSIGGLLVGGLLGACFSSLLAVIGAIVGAIWGWSRRRGRSKKRFVVVLIC